MLVVFLLFAFLVPFIGLKMMGLVNEHLQGVVSAVVGYDTLFVALFLQLATGAFVSAVYGIWLVPYLHQGMRGPLTFAMPLSRWCFPAAYGITALGLLVTQHLILLLSFGLNFGFSTFLAKDFPWSGLAGVLVLETLAFETLTFVLACLALVLGQIPTFFLGAVGLFVLQMGAAFFRFDLATIVDQIPAWVPTGKALYSVLPPFGELVFDIRALFVRPGFHLHFVAWASWLAAGFCFFRLLIGRAWRMGRAVES